MNPTNKLYDAVEFKNLRDVIKNSAKCFANNNAFIIKHKQNNDVEYEHITYKRLDEEIDSLGTAFINQGFKKKTIAVISKNRYEWMLTYLATVNGTGVLVPLDNALPPAEIESVLNRSKVDAIVFSAEHADEMRKIREEGKTNVSKFICMDKIDEFVYLKDLIKEGKKLLENGNREFIDSAIDENAMSFICFTSGTTALSKAVMLSHKNIVSNLYGLNLAEKFYETDVNMAFLPFHHTFGSTGVMLFLNNGVTNVFCDGIRYIAQNLKEYKVSVFVGVPLLIEAMYKKIVKEIEKQGKTKVVEVVKKISNFLLKFKIDIRRKLFKTIIDNLGGGLRCIVSGASALDKNVAKGFNDLGILTVQGYGLTETSPVLTAENAETIRYGSIGFPLSNVEIKIENPNASGIGEIVAKGPNVMLGYYENEEATNQVLKDGWFHTGDLAYRDKDGFIFITGKKKHVIVLKNGKNIYPEELEMIINGLPYVEESMVFGMPKKDDLTVSVKVVYNKEYIDEKFPEISETELHDMIWKDIKEINSGLVNYKRIQKLIITDEPMIKTTTQKIKRFEEIKKIINEKKQA